MKVVKQYVIRKSLRVIFICLDSSLPGNKSLEAEDFISTQKI